MSRRRNQSLAPQKALLTLLDQMRASYQVYQDSHWTVRGNDYYGNHLMLQRIYEETAKEIDGLAEMMVGSYGPEIIQEHQNDTSMWVEVFTDAADPMAGALRAAQEVRTSIDSAYDSLKKHGELGRGWDDFLMALAQEKDTHLYLLQQATNTAAQYAEERAANPTRKLKAKLLRANPATAQGSQGPQRARRAGKATNPGPRAKNVSPEQAGCVLAKHAWDRDTVECGPNAPTPAQAAQALANERWTLPPDARKQKARLLR